METIIATTSAAVCKINGQIVPCEEVWRGLKVLVGAGIGVTIFFLALVVLLTVFWVWMLVHAIRNPIEHKPVWILVLLLTGLIGAIIYYFAVKRVTPPVVAK